MCISTLQKYYDLVIGAGGGHTMYIWSQSEIGIVSENVFVELYSHYSHLYQYKSNLYWYIS